MYGYVDLDGDAAHAAEAFDQLMAQLAVTKPNQKWVTPQQLQAILRALRLDDLKAFGLSSVREANGEFRNRAFLSTPEGRHGVMAVVGGPPSAPRHLRLAPKDADLYEELEFDVPALSAAVKQVIVATKGEAGLEQLRRQSEAAKASTGVSPLGVVEALQGRVTIIVRADPTKTIALPGVPPVVIPRFALLIGVDGLASALKPLLDQSPFLVRKEEGGRAYYTPKVPIAIDGVRPVLVVDGGDLYLGSDEFFTHQCLDRAAGEGLAQNEDFQRLLRELGPEVNDVAYLAPRLISTLKLIGQPPGSPPTGPLNMLAKVLNQLPVPARPEMAVTQNLSDGVLYRARSSRSMKAQLAGGMMFNPLLAGALSGMGFNQAKANGGNGATPPAARRPPPVLTPDQRVVQNLRLLKILADAHYRRTGTDTVKVEELVGAGKVIPRLVPAEGEDYGTVELKKGQPIEVTLPDGRKLRYAPAVPGTRP